MIRSERGIALLMVLWIITILMVLVVSFSFLTKTEARSTFYFREGVQKKFYAEAGIEEALMEIYHRQVYRNQAVVLEGSEVVRVDGRPYTGEIGTGRYVIRLLNESGKININTMTDATGVVLNNLLVSLGVPKERADIIVDSMLDWVDGDNVRRLNGAEDEYYLSLPNPYKAKNGPFEVMEELLLVRDMSPDILFGSKERKGLIHFVTVYGSTSKINLNTAPQEILMALPGLTTDAVMRIMEQREAAEFREIKDIQAITGLNSEAISPYVDMGESDTYTIESVGLQGDAKKGYGIRAVVTVQGGGLSQFVYYKSPSEMHE
ncbi:MAG: putative type II secretion system protein K [Syntrophorhabdus sp. PtaU1.Bin058]|nr:MAG: putative type II secretion system protein K [Syntrophorhabdus sp. PtaU1.Bin058]